MKKVLVTGTAGFIGFHLVRRLIRKDDYQIVGLDNINDYYDKKLKYARLNESGIRKEEIQYNVVVSSEKYENYRFIKLDLTDKENVLELFNREQFDYVVNLAAQGGVRYSLKNPDAYINSNIYGFLNILEGAKENPIKHLVYASSSSVYGANKKIPFSESDNVDHPISLYAATKKANELLAHTYSAVYGVPCTGLRFFTVYGPWGRPDMAYFLFVKAILEGQPINVYNFGKMKRDFTYIDDIVDGIERIILMPPKPNEQWSGISPDPKTSFAPYRIYNIGHNEPVELQKFIAEIEKALNKKAQKNYLPMQPGDVEVTYADVSDLIRTVNYKPSTPIEIGIKKFVDWYLKFYQITL